jgi:hypothetical protein
MEFKVNPFILREREATREEGSGRSQKEEICVEINQSINQSISVA